MAKESLTPRPVCAKEAIDLLNCAAGDPSSYDPHKCLQFLDALRSCVLQNKVKKFSVAEQNQPAEAEKKTEKL